MHDRRGLDFSSAFEVMISLWVVTHGQMSSKSRESIVKSRCVFGKIKMKMHCIHDGISQKMKHWKRNGCSTKRLVKFRSLTAKQRTGN